MSETPDSAAPVLNEDPAQAMRDRGKSPELAAALAWLIPGSGHIYAGHYAKGVGGLVFVLGMFLAGLFLSRGDAVSLHEPFGHEYAFIAQIGAGGPTLVGLAYSHNKLPGLQHEIPTENQREYFLDQAYYSRLPDVDTGLLFTMVAGLLNLLLIHDVLNGVPGALQRRLDERRREQTLEALRRELAETKAQEKEEEAEEATPNRGHEPAAKSAEEESSPEAAPKETPAT